MPQEIVDACEKVHENAAQAIRFWMVFEALNGKSEEDRAGLRRSLAKYHLVNRGVETIAAMAGQTTVLALSRILDKEAKDRLSSISKVYTALQNAHIINLIISHAKSRS